MTADGPRRAEQPVDLPYRIIWRSRAKKSPALLAKIIKDPATTEEDQPRYFRAFDFLTGPEKEAALKSLLE